MTTVRFLPAAPAVSGIAAGTGPIKRSPVLAQVAAAKDLPGAVERYWQVWASRDAARIAALHTPKAVFFLVVEGSAPAIGRGVIEAQFAQIPAANPAYSSPPRSVRFGTDFVMAPPRAFSFGGWRYEPAGRSYEVPAIDVITFRGGLVSRQITYFDPGVIRTNSHRAMPAGGAR